MKLVENSSQDNLTPLESIRRLKNKINDDKVLNDKKNQKASKKIASHRHEKKNLNTQILPEFSQTPEFSTLDHRDQAQQKKHTKQRKFFDQPNKLLTINMSNERSKPL